MTQPKAESSCIEKMLRWGNESALVGIPLVLPYNICRLILVLGGGPSYFSRLRIPSTLIAPFHVSKYRSF
jgi:hypothetical protein